jgi:hypothetical protein
MMTQPDLMSGAKQSSFITKLVSHDAAVIVQTLIHLQAGSDMEPLTGLLSTSHLPYLPHPTLATPCGGPDASRLTLVVN